ncbi:Extracellular glycosidase CRH11, partial [Smittium mucronatum]
APAYSAASTTNGPAYPAVSTINDPAYSAASTTGAPAYPGASTTNAPAYSAASTTNGPAYPAVSTINDPAYSAASTTGAPAYPIISSTSAPAYYAASTTNDPAYSAASTTSTQVYSSATTTYASAISDPASTTSSDFSASFSSTFSTTSQYSSPASMESSSTSVESSSESSTFFSSSESSTDVESSSSTDLPVPTDVPISVRFYDFENGSDLGDLRLEYCPQNAVLANGNLELIMTEECGTNIIYEHPMKTGKFETVLKMAAGSGAVTALDFRGLNSDEIDVEFVGKDNYTWQSMFHLQGNSTTTDLEFHSTPGTPMDLTADYHSYGVELLDDEINWYFDGVVARTLQKTSDAMFPSQAGDSVYFGIWNGGLNNSAWAGVTDFTTGNKVAYMRSIKFTHYS